MAEKLTREQLKGLTAEQKIEYQRKQNAARVAAYIGQQIKKKQQNITEHIKKIILIDLRTERNIKN